MAHALGGVGGLPYTNSLEAFECNYRRGFRWFEVDLALTKDDELVCFHSGQEQIAGLKEPVHLLPASEVVGKKYAGRFAISTFRDLLDRADKLGDVILVTDTKGWPPQMLEAVRRTVQDAGRAGPSTRLVLQSYGEHDIVAVKHLSRVIGAEMILTLYMTGADDVMVEDLAKKYGVLAVVLDERRFTPWLAERLHAADVPVVVHTINEHREILRLTRAGVDGFYTDAYRPYETAARDRTSAIDCDANNDARSELVDWVARDVLRPGDYILKPCARRQPTGIELSACDDTAAIWGPFLAVPPQHTLRVELDVESGSQAVGFWLEILQKNHRVPLRSRDPIRLLPHERRTFSYDIAMPSGSPGIETRIGLGSPQETLLVHALKASHFTAPPSGGHVQSATALP